MPSSTEQYISYLPILNVTMAGARETSPMMTQGISSAQLISRTFIQRTIKSYYLQ
jgi:hypothetical protein